MGGALLLMVLVQLGYYIYGASQVPVLFPDGTIAVQEKNLVYLATYLMLIVVIPVFILTGVFTWKYREGNTKAKYSPDWDTNHLAEFIWWTVPLIIVTILGVISWKYTHSLDPYKPIGHEKPLKIQVVALQWKWLFLYPEQNIATVNFVQFPANRPVYFEISADAPMNSFWIPSLSGQIFAMPGMRTELNVMAKAPGEFRGSSANISGIGFAGMHFMAKATTETEFEEWARSIKTQGSDLDWKSYQNLAKPSENDPVTPYVLKELQLFDHILMSYMMPMPAADK